jgi:hypothetical protein
VTGPWWRGWSPIEVWVHCDGERLHTLRWEAGALVAVDHGPAGDPVAPCVEITAAWARHADDLRVLTLAARDAADAEAIGAGPVGVRRPKRLGSMPAMLRPPRWTLIPRPPPGSNAAFGYATAVSMHGSGPAPVDGSDPLGDISALLTLGEGLAERLVTTVACRWTDRVVTEKALALPGALTAAVHARALAAVRAWWDDPTLAAEIDVVLTGPAAVMRDPGRAVQVTVPIGWLADVWCRDLAVVDDQFVLAVDEADHDQLAVSTIDRDLTTRRSLRLDLPLAPLAPLPPEPPPAPQPPAPVPPTLTSGVVLRTDFSDDASWELVRDAIAAETEEGFQADVWFVDDDAYQGATVDDVLAETGQHVLGFIVLVDDVAVNHPDHPVLVVSLSPRHHGQRFRSIPRGIQSIENNLSLANMDWESFAGSVDDQGVFRGF